MTRDSLEIRLLGLLAVARDGRPVALSANISRER
jgi:hypothetical protein